jgi:hypothetical protein
LKDIILEAAKSYLQSMEIIKKITARYFAVEIEDCKLANDEILMYKGRIYVPNSQELKNPILREMHNVPYVGHPGYYKTIAAFKRQYHWP